MSDFAAAPSPFMTVFFFWMRFGGEILAYGILGGQLGMPRSGWEDGKLGVKEAVGIHRRINLRLLVSCVVLLPKWRSPCLEVGSLENLTH
jgi:hypothetical protein